MHGKIQNVNLTSFTYVLNAFTNALMIENLYLFFFICLQYYTVVSAISWTVQNELWQFSTFSPYAYLMTRLSTIKKKKKSTATLSLPSFCKKCPEDPLVFFMSTFMFFRNECSFGTDEKLVDDDSLMLLFRPYGWS